MEAKRTSKSDILEYAWVVINTVKDALESFAVARKVAVVDGFGAQPSEPTLGALLAMDCFLAADARSHRIEAACKLSRKVVRFIFHWGLFWNLFNFTRLGGVLSSGVYKTTLILFKSTNMSRGVNDKHEPVAAYFVYVPAAQMQEGDGYEGQDLLTELPTLGPSRCDPKTSIDSLVLVVLVHLQGYVVTFKSRSYGLHDDCGWKWIASTFEHDSCSKSHNSHESAY
eukprot:6486110-Amphidinium_carterae.1